MGKEYEELTDSNGKKYLHFKKSPELGFDFEFDIYFPTNIADDANLLLSFYDMINQGRLTAMLDKIEMPIMITKVENVPDKEGKVINYKQFDRQALINKDGSKVRYGTLETSIVEQYKEAISEAYKVLKEMQIIRQENDEKIDIEGYSAQGVKAQRLAFLIPENVRSSTVGGAISSIPLPVNEINGVELPYPAGTGELEKILGTEDLQKWKAEYEKLVQIVYATEQELKFDGNFTRDGNRIKRNEDLTKDESSYSQITVSQHDISSEVANVVPLQIKLWGSDINDRINGARETINSNGGKLQKVKIYKGISHHFLERGEEAPKEFLNDMAKALSSLNKGQELNGFDDGANRIDTSYEEVRTYIQERLKDAKSRDEYNSKCRKVLQEIASRPDANKFLEVYGNKKTSFYDFTPELIEQYRPKGKNGLDDCLKDNITRFSDVQKATTDVKNEVAKGEIEQINDKDLTE